MRASAPISYSVMIDEVASRGYWLLSGTLQPMLAKRERDGYPISTTKCEGRTSRKFSTVTQNGREGLQVAPA